MGNFTSTLAELKASKTREKASHKYNKGKPVGLNSGIRIKYNESTGLLEGFPREWAEQYNLNLPIDRSKMVQGGQFDVHIRASELP